MNVFSQLEWQSMDQNQRSIRDMRPDQEHLIHPFRASALHALKTNEKKSANVGNPSRAHAMMNSQQSPRSRRNIGLTIEHNQREDDEQPFSEMPLQND